MGKIVGATAAQRFKHCSLELGGKNPMIVLDDANLDLAICRADCGHPAWNLYVQIFTQGINIGFIHLPELDQLLVSRASLAKP